jgi:hypothetical protein
VFALAQRRRRTDEVEVVDSPELELDAPAAA